MAHARSNRKYDPYLLDGIPSRMGYLPQRGQYKLHDPVSVYGNRLGYEIVPHGLGQFDWSALLQTGIDYYKQKAQLDAQKKAIAAAQAQAQAAAQQRALIEAQQAAAQQIVSQQQVTIDPRTGAALPAPTGGFNWMWLLPLAAIPIVLLTVRR